MNATFEQDVKSVGKDIKRFHTHKSENAHHAGGHDDAHSAMSVRKVHHAGKEIEIQTHYVITVDGEPLNVHISVGNDGKAHCHSLPNYGFASMVDLVRELIDAFNYEVPEDELSHLGEHEDTHSHASHANRSSKKRSRRKAKRSAKKRSTKKRSSRKKKKKARKKTKRKTAKRKSSNRRSTGKKRKTRRSSKESLNYGNPSQYPH